MARKAVTEPDLSSVMVRLRLQAPLRGTVEGAVQVTRFPATGSTEPLEGTNESPVQDEAQVKVMLEPGSGSCARKNRLTLGGGLAGLTVTSDDDEVRLSTTGRELSNPPSLGPCRTRNTLAVLPATMSASASPL